MLKTWILNKGILSISGFVHLGSHTIWSVIYYDNMFVCATDSGELVSCRLSLGEYSAFDNNSMDSSKIIFWSRDILDFLPEHFAPGSQALVNTLNGHDDLGSHIVLYDFDY